MASNARKMVAAKQLNRSLAAAKASKQDEFYTQYVDIQKEVEAYLEFDPDTFRGKVVYCNCDDPFESNFFKLTERELCAGDGRAVVAGGDELLEAELVEVGGEVIIWECHRPVRGATAAEAFANVRRDSFAGTRNE
jgi:hypothetical protein